MKYLISLLFVITSFLAVGQELSEKEKAYNEKVDKCLKKIFAGDPTGLYHLGEFLSDETEFTRVRKNGTSRVSSLRRIALGILYYNCYFKGLKLDKSLKQNTYNEYIKKNGSKVIYYSHLGRFSDLDIYNVKLPHRIRKAIPKPKKPFDQLKDKIQEKKQKGRYSDMISVFWEMGALQTTEVEDYLLACADGKHWGIDECEYKEKVLSGIAFSLGNFRTKRSFDKLIKLASDYDLYAIEDWAKAIARVTNRELVTEEGGYKGVVENYKKLREEFKDIKAIKKSGYNLFNKKNEIFEISPLEMTEAIDFEWWIFDNLKKDLIEKKDPLVLYVISSRILKDLYVYNDKSKEKKFNFFEKYKWADIEFDLIQMLTEQTGVVVELQYKGAWKTKSNDFEFNVALMNYWKNHYKDFKFKKKTGLFENRKEKILEPDRLKVYFENMHTEDDELAFESYQKLIEEDPEKVIQVMRGYSMDYIMGNLNDNLPMFTRKFLVQQCYLVNYCKENNILFKPSGALLALLEKIRTEKPDFKSQLEAEKQLYDKITTDNIIAIENYAITYGSRNSRLSTVIGHVLDQWYSNNIDLIVRDSLQLRNYLYKADLYDHLGIVGVVNNYMRKLYSVNPGELDVFEHFAQKGKRKSVRKNALAALNNNLYKKKDTTVQNGKITFNNFLKVQDEIDKVTLKNVYIDTTNKDALKVFFDSFADESNPDVLLKYIYLMENYLHVDMVPYFIKNYNRKEELRSGSWGGTDMKRKRHRVRFKIYTNDYMVFFTEKIFDYYNRSPRPDIFNNTFVSSSSSGGMFLWNKHKTQDFWLKKWEKNAKGYPNWGKELFALRLKKLNSSDTISFNELEEVVESKYWNKDVSQLKNVLPRLHCDDLLDIKQEWNLPGYSLRYVLENCNVSERNLKVIAEKFFRSDFPEVLIWLKKQVLEAENKIKAGDRLTSLCWNNTFKDSLKLDKYQHHREWIINALKEYSDSTDYEFDKEYADAFHIELLLSSLSFKDQLKKIAEMESIGVEVAQERLIENATFEDIKANWEQLFAFMILNSDVKDKIRDKFGLFITDDDIDHSDFLDKVVLTGDNLSASYALLERYYKLKTADGKWDYNAVFNMLKYGDMESFVGSERMMWLKLYNCALYYISKSWETELKAFAKMEYPNLAFDSKEVVLNYMVHKGYIASQKYVPVSFAKDKVLFIR